MTYEQVVAKVKAKYENVDASSVDGTLAIQVNLVGKNVEGIFYIEAKDGKVNVEPYDYHDNKAVVTVAPTNLLKILDGKLNPVIAYTTGKVSVLLSNIRTNENSGKSVAFPAVFLLYFFIFPNRSSARRCYKKCPKRPLIKIQCRKGISPLRQGRLPAHTKCGGNIRGADRKENCESL